MDLRTKEKSRDFLLKYGQGAIQSDEGKAMATRISAELYCECSAKTSEGVDAVFEAAAVAALKVIAYIMFLCNLVCRLHAMLLYRCNC